MLFKNKLIFNESKTRKSNNKDDIDIDELKNNIEQANSEMEGVLSTAGVEKKSKDKKSEISTKEVEKELKNSKTEDDDNFGTVEADNFYEPEDDEESLLNDKDYNKIKVTNKTKKSNKQTSNNIIEFDDDSDDLENIEDAIDYANDDEEEIDYMGDDSDELSLSDYIDDSEDLDDIDSKIETEINDDTANDGEFDPDDELDNIDADIDKANDEEFEISDEEEIEDDIIQDSDPSMPDGDIQGKTIEEEEGPEEFEAEVDPEISGEPAKLPTDGLDDIESDIDDATKQNNMESEPNAFDDDTGYDPNDPLYYDDSDPLANDEDPKEEESQRLKKLVLLNQYKDLISIIGDFSYTVEKLREVPDFENDEDIEYIINQLNSMKDKISFTVEHKFLTAEYEDLLKIFYYFKFGINSVSKFMQKLIQSKKMDKNKKKK